MIKKDPHVTRRDRGQREGEEERELHGACVPERLAEGEEGSLHPGKKLALAHLPAGVRKGPHQGGILCGRQGLGKAASRAGSLTPIATSFPVYLVTDGAES